MTKSVIPFKIIIILALSIFLHTNSAACVGSTWTPNYNSGSSYYYSGYPYKPYHYRTLVSYSRCIELYLAKFSRCSFIELWQHLQKGDNYDTVYFINLFHEVSSLIWAQLELALGCCHGENQRIKEIVTSILQK